MIAITQVPEVFKQESEWDQTYALLQKHIEENGKDSLHQDSPEFWLVTASPKLNQWLVYNRIELKKARRQADPQWQERKARLQQLGVQL